MEQEALYIWKNNKQMRCGYTTGSCAAAAAKAASWMLLTGENLPLVELLTPAGIRLFLEVEEVEKGEGWVSCAVRKDGGDDTDATHGILIFAKVFKSREPGVWLDGGVGVGRITRKGLEQKIGEAAINRVPRQMILQSIEEQMSEYPETGGIRVEISVPEGERAAKKTFNPRLGIEGGISILGTTGIVVPMSEKALVDCINLEIRQKLAEGNGYLVFSPGNYGETFSLNQFDIAGTGLIRISNFIGESIDMAVEQRAKGILFIGHIGKFVKLAAGIMNTHSRSADARMEIMSAHTILCGGSLELAKKVLSCVTTDECIEILKMDGKLKPVVQSLLERMLYYTGKRAYDRLEIGIVLYSNEHGLLGMTEQVPDLLRKL